jgi:hypothetical protein
MLKRKKMNDSQLENYYGQRYKIEEQLIGLESAENTASVLDVLSLGSTTTKKLLDESTLDIESVE